MSIKDLHVSLESRPFGKRTISSEAGGPSLQKVVAREIKPKLQAEGAHFQQP